MYTNKKSELGRIKLEETIRAIIRNQIRIIDNQEFEYSELNTAYMFYDMFKDMDITGCEEIDGLSFNINDQQVLEKNNTKIKTAIDYIYCHKKTLINHLFRLLKADTSIYKNIIGFISDACTEYKIDDANKESLILCFQSAISKYTNESIIPPRALQYINSELLKSENTIISQTCKELNSNDIQTAFKIDYLFKRLHLYDIITEEEKKQIKVVYRITEDSKMYYYTKSKQENIIVHLPHTVSFSELTISDYIGALILLDKAGYYKFNIDSIVDIKIDDNKKEITITYDKCRMDKNEESKVSLILMKSFVVKSIRYVILSTFHNSIRSAINKWYMCYYDKNILNDIGITKTDLMKLYILNHYVESSAYENPILDKNNPKLKNISYE